MEVIDGFEPTNDGFADHPPLDHSGILTSRASSRIRTYDLLITSELHYRCAIEANGSRHEA